MIKWLREPSKREWVILLKCGSAINDGEQQSKNEMTTRMKCWCCTQRRTENKKKLYLLIVNIDVIQCFSCVYVCVSFPNNSDKYKRTNAYKLKYSIESHAFLLSSFSITFVICGRKHEYCCFLRLFSIIFKYYYLFYSHWNHEWLWMNFKQPLNIINSKKISFMFTFFLFYSFLVPDKSFHIICLVCLVYNYCVKKRELRFWQSRQSFLPSSQALVKTIINLQRVVPSRFRTQTKSKQNIFKNQNKQIELVSS